MLYVIMFGNIDEGVFSLRKTLPLLLCTILFICAVSGASAQTVPCPKAHLYLNVPDDWSLVTPSGNDDPGLCLLLGNGDITLSVYIDDIGGDPFQIFTGDDTESSGVTYSGVRMTCVAGRSSEGDYRIYTWLDERNQVQFYFLIVGGSKASRGLIEDIMGSIVFE